MVTSLVCLVFNKSFMLVSVFSPLRLVITTFVKVVLQRIDMDMLKQQAFSTEAHQGHFKPSSDYRSGRELRGPSCGSLVAVWEIRMLV